jgi:hypothetical protein
MASGAAGGAELAFPELFARVGVEAEYVQPGADDGPRPGSSTFQRKFSVGLQDVGRFFSSETPLAGPRNWSQSPAGAGLRASRRQPRVEKAVRHFMEKLLHLPLAAERSSTQQQAANGSFVLCGFG